MQQFGTRFLGWLALAAGGIQIARGGPRILHDHEVKGTLRSPTFRWLRTVATALSILFFIYVGWSVWINYSDPPGVDFVSFWAAGRLAVQAHPTAAYDIPLHRLLERSVGPMTGLMPFPYPPPFLLFVIPFGMLPFVPAMAAWVVATALLYFVAFRRIAPWPYTFAHPAAFSNALVGQNGMLTSAIFAGGFTLLDRCPLLAGGLLGLLVIKPQLAFLFPVALVAGRCWRTLAGAAMSASVLLLTAWLVFGQQTYRAFFELAPRQAGLMNGSIPWPKIASVFGDLRTVGIPIVPALIVHTAIAAAAAAVTWVAWRRDLPTRVPIVAAASLLISPYLFNHDALLMMIPVGWLIVHERRPAIIILLWALSFVSLMAIGPNVRPLAAIIAIAVMWQEGTRPARETRGFAATPATAS
jgi:alpha-1,2-mannosyltransferase